MSLKIYNTLTSRLEEFVPIDPPKVSIYTCGVTVYDDSHVGHARSLIVFDCLRRYLEHLGYRVLFVRNFTDIDDKIINRSKEENTHFMNISNRYIASYYQDMEELNIKPADVEPRVSEHIPEIISVIQKLIDLDYAYEANGDVYFKVRKFNSYGKLSCKDPEELQAGARIEPSENKKDPLDFALWKSAKAGEPSFDSPWGPGRPGWHTECVAMIFKHLGESIDIHGGGLDLTFPHHENEIAQAEAITNKPFARYWVHNGLVTVNGQKMSKSLGNFITIKEVLSKYDPDVLRLLVLFTHYRSPLDFSWDKMEESKRAYRRIKDAIEGLSQLRALEKTKDQEVGLLQLLEKTRQDFFSALSEDFNTPEALGAIFNLVSAMNKVKTESIQRGNISENTLKEYSECVNFLEKTLRGVFGLFEKQGKERQLSQREELGFIELLISARESARSSKDYKTADLIRDGLRSLGIALEDTPLGTRWQRV
ncbi:MAG: cysteine--tRNA ligase [Aquificaceae bacterium]|nr:cysteine--tRNA ligase [Aquificaceae bacterium]MDW8236928.1 cysteine--tRNA ligase [Aquificaceae bacterium]